MRAILHVCTTCRGGQIQDDDPDAPRPGAHLHHALVTALSATAPDGADTDADGDTAASIGTDIGANTGIATDCGVDIRPVECLSACNHGCAVALSGAGRWSYVYGRLTLDDVPDILAGARAYAATADGIVPWRARPVIFRKQSLARIPPQE